MHFSVLHLSVSAFGRQIYVARVVSLVITNHSVTVIWMYFVYALSKRFSKFCHKFHHLYKDSCLSRFYSQGEALGWSFFEYISLLKRSVRDNFVRCILTTSRSTVDCILFFFHPSAMLTFYFLIHWNIFMRNCLKLQTCSITMFNVQNGCLYICILN